VTCNHCEDGHGADDLRNWHCDDDDDRDDHWNHGHDGDFCDTLGIRACFSTAALNRLFDRSDAVVANSVQHHGNRLPCALLDAQILATLTDGRTVVARFGDLPDDVDSTGDGHHGDDPAPKPNPGCGKDALKAQATPNPLNPTTVLSFTTAQDGRISVTVFDMQGRVVRKLMNEFRVAGQQTLPWDGRNDAYVKVPSGVYFLRIQAPEGFVTRRVAVVK
jgi:hypothetical protein